MDVSRQEFENVLDLGLESAGQHLVGLVQNEELQVVGLQEAAAHHVVHTSWGANDNMLALLEDTDVLTDNSATNTGVHLGVKELTDGVHHVGDLHGQLTRG